MCVCVFAECVRLLTQHKQLAAGFSCEIVRVKIDPDFSKEQLAELFINSGKIISVGRGGEEGLRLWKADFLMRRTKGKH